jgi:hypothetical protein
LAQAGSTIFWSSRTGSQYAYFGQGDWPKLAPGPKSIDDATLIRRRVLLAFEEARSSFLTFPAVRVTDGIFLGISLVNPLTDGDLHAARAMDAGPIIVDNRRMAP